LECFFVFLQFPNGLSATQVTVRGCSFERCHASDPSASAGGGGAALVWTDASLTMDASRVADCSAGRGGGIVVGRLGSLSLSGSVAFDRCRAKRGGAVFVDTLGLANIEATFRNNSVQSANLDDFGGAVFSSLGQLWLSGARFEGNSALRGGAVYVGLRMATSLVVERCTFVGNYAQLTGGAFVCNECEMGTLSGCLFRRNRAPYGGAVAVYGAALRNPFAQCTFESNSARSNGGAVYFWQNAHNDPTIGAGSRFANNSAAVGGALFFAMNTRIFQLAFNASFVGNAAPFGPDYASLPVALRADSTTALFPQRAGPLHPLSPELAIAAVDMFEQTVPVDDPDTRFVSLFAFPFTSLTGLLTSELDSRGVARFPGVAMCSRPGSPKMHFRMLSNQYVTGELALDVLPCPGGEQLAASLQCELCGAGAASANGTAFCKPCAAGFFSSIANATACLQVSLVHHQCMASMFLCCAVCSWHRRDSARQLVLRRLFPRLPQLAGSWRVSALSGGLNLRHAFCQVLALPRRLRCRIRSEPRLHSLRCRPLRKAQQERLRQLPSWQDREQRLQQLHRLLARIRCCRRRER
jgi:predicted outer membrane repeat protein